MEVREKFKSVWKNHYNVLSVSLYSLIMVVVEEIMELEFKCPQEKSLRVWYVTSYFSCPAFITFVLSLTSHPACIPWAHCVGKCSCYRKTQIIFRAFLPPVIWCVILLCDGRYIDCVISGNEGNNIQSRADELPSEFYTKSQVSGLFILTAVVTLCGLCHVFPCWFCCKNEEGHWREELQSRLEEGAMNHIEELKNEGVEQIMEERVKPLLQPDNANFWENIDLRNIGKKIKEVVDSVLGNKLAERQPAGEQGLPLNRMVRGTPS